MSFAARLQGAFRRRRERFYYERIQPDMSLEAIYAALAPGLDVDLQAPDGFARLWAEHMAVTPASLWEVMPVPTSDAVSRIRRGEVRVLARDFVITPETDWHLEPFHGVSWPRVHVESCPFSIPGGDIELVWHLNRMEFLLDYSAAYRATHDDALAHRMYALMASWAENNPYLVGPNWISPMQMGMRLAYWSLALAGMKTAPLPSPEQCETILRSMLRQTDHLASHFSHWPVPNNHLIGEAAMLYTVAAYWPILENASLWRRKSEATLLEEVKRQVLGDGFDFEHSVNYHMLVLDFLLLYLHAKIMRGETPDAFILKQTHAMADAALALVAPSGRLPMIGDDSFPRFIMLRGTMGSPGPISRHVTFEDFLRLEHARLFTTTAWGRDLLLLRRPVTHARRFHEAGIDVARTEDTHIVFTHGPQHRHPFSNGHLHADAGSFELELSGTPVVVDSGTCLYYGGESGLRSHMRSARAHNAVLIDGVEKMKPVAPFQWENVASAEMLGFGAREDVMVTGCRQQLRGLDGAGVDHVRVLVRVGSTVIIADALSPTAGLVDIAYTAAAYFHTPATPGAAVVDGHRVRLTDASQFIRVFEVLDEPHAAVDLIDVPVDLAALYSSAYGEAATGTTIRVSVPVRQTVVLVSVIRDPGVAVTRTRTRVGQIGCAIEDGHTRRILSLRLDPFAAYVGGRSITGLPEAMPAGPRPAESLEWLDELDV